MVMDSRRKCPISGLALLCVNAFLRGAGPVALDLCGIIRIIAAALASVRVHQA